MISLWWVFIKVIPAFRTTSINSVIIVLMIADFEHITEPMLTNILLYSLTSIITINSNIGC